MTGAAAKPMPTLTSLARKRAGTDPTRLADANPSTRILFALAYERGPEYDPGQPLCPTLVDDSALIEVMAQAAGGRRTVTVERL